jgi:hypothetical protein
LLSSFIFPASFDRFTSFLSLLATLRYLTEVPFLNFLIEELLVEQSIEAN